MSNFLIDEDTDLLAAEFVLGTLDSEERANAQSLLRMDHGFIAMVRIWERRFGELHLMVEPVEPDAKIAQRIKAKIAELPPREPAPGSPALGSHEGPPPEGPAPEGKPPVDSPVVPQIVDGPAHNETANPADAAISAQAPKLDVAGSEATPKPEDKPADGTTPKPAETAATGEGAKAAETQPALGSGTAAVAEIPPTPESQAPVGMTRPEGESGPTPPAAIAPSPPQPEAVALIRSRGRWRAFGLVMSLLVVGLTAMLAVWRFVPDRLPARLRPAELMTSLGIQTPLQAGPVVKPAPPESQFDE
jgi:hypothetical protein